MYKVVASTYTSAIFPPTGMPYWRVQAKGLNGPSDWTLGWRITITP